MDRSQSQALEESVLIREIRAGDSAAWGTVYELYAHSLYRRVLMPRLADPTAAEDALSETFRTAIQKFEQFEEREGSTLLHWLTRIAHNKAMDMHRARATTGRKISDLRRLLVPLLPEEKGAEDLLLYEVETEQNRLALNDCLDSLNPRYQKALRMRFLEETPREECAQQLGVKVATFDVLLLRAVRALRKAWGERKP